MNKKSFITLFLFEVICYILIGDFMLYIGSHVSFSKNDQLLGSVKEAISYNANTFMFYTGAPQNTMRYPIDKNIVKEAIELMKENNIKYSKVIVHAPYIVNLANTEKLDYSVDFLTEEINRCNDLGIKNMVLHPGSHVGLGVEVGLNNIINGLNRIVSNTKDVVILLETMAGKGTELGTNIDEIKYIINGIKDKSRIGVCLDTCHLHDSGIDLTKFDEYLDIFDKEIGINKIHCIHINDSKNTISSHKDRHANIGQGEIGFNTLINIIYNKRLGEIPRILETPYIEDKAPYKEEIEMIRNKKQ